MFYFNLLHSKKIYPISRGNFEQLTDKKFPYCQDLRGRIRYFGLCPSCGNPIHFINLFSQDVFDEDGKQRMHGRHYIHDVPGLAKFDQKSFSNCPFRDRHAKRLYNRKPGKEKNLEVVNLMRKHRELLKECIISIMGIQISEEVFSRLVGNFILAKGFYFKQISKFNLPYSFLYLLPNEYLYNCICLDDEIISAVKTNGHYFTINKYNRLIKKVDEYAEFEFLVVNYHKNSTGEFLDYELIERMGTHRNVLLKKEIQIDETLFYNRMIESEGV